MGLSRKGVRVLGDLYLARCGNGFEAYMALQRALIARWVARGGTEQSWCERMAPSFRRRYGWLGYESAA
ncbi:MAG: hypothetical protein KFH98_06895 [Gemmatimonadetes bacterium]|nr:hypothetical protein [Gemmatimonadota bacterium]